MIKNYSMGELNFNLVKKGAMDFVNAEGSPADSNFTKQFKVDPNEMNRIMNEFITARRAYTAAVNRDEEIKFLDSNKAKEGVQVTESGLQYVLHNPGSDKKPANNRDTVYVHYKLSLTDGSVIEEVAADRQPVHFTLNRVIPGWTEGLKLIGEGGNATLYVPSALAYGEQGNNGIPPCSTLVFDVQLDSVKFYVEPEPEEPAKK